MNSVYPPVTVFSLIYNSGEFVIRAIQSVRRNNYPNLQHIVIDDCSTDSISASLVKEWIEKENYPCIYIQHTQNMGICKTLNEVLSLATGKYILGVNDDLIDENRIISDVTKLEQAGETVAALWSDVKVIDEYDKLVYPSYLATKEYETDSKKLYHSLLTHCFIPMPGATLNISIVNKEGGFNEKIYMEDWDLWLRLSKKYEIIYSPEIHTSYRIRKGSVTSSPTAKFYRGCFLSVYENLDSEQAYHIAKDKLIYFAEMHYKLKGDESGRLFYKILKYEFTFKVLVFFIASILYFPYSVIDNIRRLGKIIFKANG